MLLDAGPAQPGSVHRQHGPCSRSNAGLPQHEGFRTRPRADPGGLVGSVTRWRDERGTGSCRGQIRWQESISGTLVEESRFRFLTPFRRSRRPLRFSRSGNPGIEQANATHLVTPRERACQQRPGSEPLSQSQLSHSAIGRSRVFFTAHPFILGTTASPVRPLGSASPGV